MILGISIFIGKNTEYEFLKEYSGYNLQIGFYKKSDFDFASKNHLGQKLKDQETKVISAHLPVDLDFKNSDEIEYYTIATCKEFSLQDNVLLTLHPKYKVDLDYSELNTRLDRLSFNLKIGLENFPWKKKKTLRSPLDITEVCSKYNHFSMTLDLAHLEYYDLWLDEKILGYLLRYTSIIHLSNKRGHKGHIPIREGKINIEQFLKELIKNKWNGNIFLEYGIDYKDRLIEDLEWVERVFKNHYPKNFAKRTPS